MQTHLTQWLKSHNGELTYRWLASEEHVHRWPGRWPKHRSVLAITLSSDTAGGRLSTVAYLLDDGDDLDWGLTEIQRMCQEHDQKRGG